MDEPTASLDPDVADRTLSYIEKLRKDRQITVLYTSHNMTEVTRICDRVIFIDGAGSSRTTPRLD
jgi:ABC-2 type transport system ATP-binding protein